MTSAGSPPQSGGTPLGSAAPRTRLRRLGRRFERACKRRVTHWLARTLRPRPSPIPLAADVRSLLAIRQHNQMGDMVLTLPALRALRRAYPLARIVFVASPLCQELLTDHPDIDTLIVFNKHSLWRPMAFWRLVRALRHPRPDLAVVLGTVSFSTTSALLAWASGARLRAGVSSRAFGSDLSGAIYHLELPLSPSEVHEVEHNLAPLRGLGIDTPVELPNLSPHPAALLAAREFIARAFPSQDGPVVVVHPGAGKTENIWPVERFAEVAQALTQQGARIVVSEGPRDGAVTAALLSRCPGAVRWHATLRDTIGILGCAQAFIGNDTGLAHVAAATGIPTVAIFGPTDPKRWSPAGRSVRCVRSATGRIEDTRVNDVLAAVHNSLRASLTNSGRNASLR